MKIEKKLKWKNKIMKEYHPKKIGFSDDATSYVDRDRILNLIADTLYENTKELLGSEVVWDIFEAHMKDIFAAVDNFKKIAKEN